ncbi:flagellar biosynthetic protein FliR [Methylicorpusculum oleiharenae]|uniref:flagellar biosynthetic protein FliR n=1 Tax=Methylicorpusculum oleiharenae TaxID=1338687 RepID=UPI00135B1B3F|nr:flagellar biosynthetic protein FliR [Methylicorpusculum oleiharenae]MCD2450709.1 flagellar biosynthetic protein FliR [Methylicorpusculum oleiharenae]
MHFTEAELMAKVTVFVWPLIRIGALFIAAPLFSLNGVPARVRLILAVVLTLVVIPVLPPLPPIDLFSYQGLLITAHQVFIGLATGFILQMVFGAIVFGGQGIAYGMGLGFASMVDPQNGQQVPVVAQFYVIMSTLIFLAMDGHLLLIKLILDSFATLPIAVDSLDKADIWSIIAWGSRLFAGGLLLALPVIASLLLVNVSFGVASRAAPQLNIFSIGFPVTLMLGLLLIWLTLPSVLDNFTGLLMDAYELIGQILRI